MATAKEDLNIPLILTVGILFVVLTFVSILLLQVYFFKAQTEELAEKVIETRSEELAGYLAEQQGELSGYRWIDPEKGVVGIPIERAMELIVRETGENPDSPAEDWREGHLEN